MTVTLIFSFFRAMLRKARLCHAKHCYIVRLSVCCLGDIHYQTEPNLSIFWKRFYDFM